MYQENKVQIVSPYVPRSMCISLIEYSKIYPDRIPRRLILRFGYTSKSVIVETSLAEYIIDKYPEIHYMYPVKDKKDIDTDTDIAPVETTNIEEKINDEKSDCTRDNKESGRPNRHSIRKR